MREKGRHLPHLQTQLYKGCERKSMLERYATEAGCSKGAEISVREG